MSATLEMWASEWLVFAQPSKYQWAWEFSNKPDMLWTPLVRHWSWSGTFMPTRFVLGCARSQAFRCSHFNRCREHRTYRNPGTREHTRYAHWTTTSVTCQTGDLVPFTKAAWMYLCVYVQIYKTSEFKRFSTVQTLWSHHYCDASRQVFVTKGLS